MKIIETEFSDQILKTVNHELGNISFLKDIAVVELHEGVHFDLKVSGQLIGEFINFFGKNRSYGVVANRINSYSVNLIDVPVFRSQAKNLIAYGVVGHDLAGKMNAEIENGFCFSEKVDYDTITEAINNVRAKINTSNSFSLN